MDLGNLLMGGAQGAGMMGPPAPPQPNILQRIGGILMPPQSAGALPRGPGEAVQLPPGMNPIQQILYRTQNDPNFARALVAAGATMGTAPRSENIVRNLTRAIAAGTGTLEAGRAQEQQQATTAGDKQYARDQTERRTASIEHTNKVKEEEARRNFIMNMERMKTANEFDQKRLDIENKRLAAETARIAEARTREGKETPADREFRVTREFLKSQADAAGVPYTEDGLDYGAITTIQAKQAKPQSSGFATGPAYNAALSGVAQNVEYGTDPSVIADQAIAITKSAQEKLSTPASTTTPEQAGLEVLRRLVPQRGGPTGRFATGSAGGKGWPELPPSKAFKLPQKIIGEEGDNFVIALIGPDGKPTSTSKVPKVRVLEDLKKGR